MRTMVVRFTAVVVVVLVAALAVGMGVAGGQQAATVQVATNATYGPILVDSQGRTLYILTSEKNGTLACTSTTCLGIWPPLTVAAGATPTAGAGVTGTLAVLTRPDGTRQATYNTYPLYYFKGDTAAGQTKGQGLMLGSGTWEVVKVASVSGATTPAATSTATTSTSGTSATATSTATGTSAAATATPATVGTPVPLAAFPAVRLQLRVLGGRVRMTTSFRRPLRCSGHCILMVAAGSKIHLRANPAQRFALWQVKVGGRVRTLKRPMLAVTLRRAGTVIARFHH